MPRHPTRPLTLTLALLVLVVIAPTHAMALPQGDTDTTHSVAERHQATGLFSQLWSLVSVLWSENGSALEPDGASASSEPRSENGSILDPDGRP